MVLLTKPIFEHFRLISETSVGYRGFFVGVWTSPLAGEDAKSESCEDMAGGVSLKIMYSQSQLDRAQKLRKKMTKEEWLLWSYIKDRQNFPTIFRRQQVFGPYILDFYSKKAKLVIELDGSQHAEEKHIAYDKQRDEYLQKYGLLVKRYWNDEIHRNIEQVLDDIWEIAEQRKTPPL